MEEEEEGFILARNQQSSFVYVSSIRSFCFWSGLGYLFLGSGPLLLGGHRIDAVFSIDSQLYGTQ